MKIKLLLIASLFSLNNYSQGCVDRIVTSDDMMTVYLLNGTTLTWGRNQFGQLGNNTTVQQNTPNYTVNGDQWRTIDHARMHTVALKQDHTLWAWGNNAVAQLGNGTLIDSYVPVQVGSDSDWEAVSPGNLHTVALKTNGTLWGWGNNGAYEINSSFNPSYQVNPIPLGTDSDWNKIYGGYFKTFAIKNNGTLWGRGRNNYGDLGNGTTSALLTMTQIGTDTDWKTISCARNMYTLGLKTDGRLWAWGDNQTGRLGDGTVTNHYTPVQIGNDTWTEVAAGNFHAIGIKADGTLWQWGTYGLINGQFLIPNSYVPVQVGTDNHWKSVMAGYCSSYAIKDDNTLWAWGYNGGYLGDGTSTSRAMPILIPCEQLAQIQFNQPQLVLYPNPVKDILNVGGLTNLQSVDVINILGQKVLSGSINENSIDLSGLTNGIYVGVFHTTDGQVFKSKFSKKK